jgi:hypothetical protein
MLIKSNEPWYSEGESVLLIKVHTEQFGLPGCTGGANCSEALTYHFELYDSRGQSGNKGS